LSLAVMDRTNSWMNHARLYWYMGSMPTCVYVCLCVRACVRECRGDFVAQLTYLLLLLIDSSSATIHCLKQTSPLSHTNSIKWLYTQYRGVRVQIARICKDTHE
jgi:hypothetical protein